LAAFDRALGEAGERVAPAYREADGWLEQTRAGLFELLCFCDERPDTARQLVVDSIAWGPGVLERRGQMLDALAAALDRGRAPSDLESLPSETSVNLVGACVSLVHTHLLGDERGPLAELAPSLMNMISRPYLGDETARRELERPLAYAGAQPAEHGSPGAVSSASQHSY
jgi:hypothetical protein